MRFSFVLFLLSSVLITAATAAPPPVVSPVAPVATGEIRGRAVDTASQKGVPGVTVSLVGESRVTASGANGVFTLVGVPAGARVIECASAGYPSVLVAVEVKPGGVHQVRCDMKAGVYSDKVAFASKLNAAMSGEGAEFVMGQGHGGMGVRGMGTGGGGEGVGRIHGMGRIDTGGVRGKSASLGEAGRVGTGSITVRGYGSGAGSGYSAAMVAAPRATMQRYSISSARVAVAGPPAEASRGQTADPLDASREGYDGVVENDFLAVSAEPLSTFSIDVDSASYANVRRFLRQNSRPPRDAVRIEELINYFRYDYPNPVAGQPFSIDTEVSEAPWKPEHRLVRIGVQGQRIPAAHLPPANLTFLIDVSGSMNDPRKLPLLQQSFRLLVDQLRPQDRVAMVVYAGAAGVVLPPTEGSDKGRIIEALENLRAGGSTAGAAGIRLAYDVARRSFVKGGNNRVVLATDGDFNVGTSSDGELVQLIEEERKSGVFLTVLGFGMGNYQDAKMQKLADAGNGNHAYIDDLEEARKTLVAEMGATLLTIAKDVKIQVEFNPSRVKAYRLIGYENRRLANADFNNDQKDAGELGAGHSVTVLYEIVPANSKEPIAGVDELKYQRLVATETAGAPELLTVKLRHKAPDGDQSRLITRALVDAHTPLAGTSDDFRFATAVAEFGLLLRESPHKGGASFGAVLSRAQGALGRNEGGLRTGFLEMVRSAASIHGQAIAQ